MEAALEHCELWATQVIAKLDRLSRDARFVVGMQKIGVKSVCTGMLDVNILTVIIMSLVAQQEREIISQRTKATLAASKAQGVKLGCPNGAKHLRRYGNELGVEAIKVNADARAESLRATLQDIQRRGVISFARIPQKLNSQ